MHRGLLVVLVSLLAYVSADACPCNLRGTDLTIVDVPEFDKAIQEVYEEYMKTIASPKFNRLAATILVRRDIAGHPAWLRGSVNPTLAAYPASCVKLTYMLGAINWCRENKKSPNCLDKHVRPMITISSNLATGFVVDVITNSTNIDDLHETSDPRWDAWIAKRRYTENLLKKLDLYDNQLVLSKTYPTNSGQIYGGAEQVIVNTWGKNLLQPCCAASLMLYIMESNGLTDEEKEYAKSVLFHTLDSNYTPTGRAYPAGTLFYDKSGEAYDTVEDISHFTLPNGQKGVLTIFSNGFQRGESDFYVIARFAEMILAKFQLNNGSPPTFTVTADQNITCSGPSAKVHKRDATSPDTIGNTFFTMSTSAGDTPDVCTIQVHIPKEGLYAVHVYTPTYDHMTDGSTTITFHDKYQASATAYQPRETMSSWAPVGEYIFTAGTLSMQITNANVKKASGEHVINAVRFSMYPLP